MVIVVGLPSPATGATTVRRSNLCTGYSCLKAVCHGTAETVAAAARDRAGPVHGIGVSRSLAGRALRGARLFEAARLCRRRGPDAGARHRRHHRDLQRRLRRVVEAAALSRARAAGEPAANRAARGRHESRPRHLSDVSREPAGVRGDRRLGSDRGVDHRRRRSGTRAGTARQRVDAASVARAAHSRPRLQRRRRYAGRAAARDADPWLLAAPFRRRGQRRRPAAGHRWHGR